MSRVRKKPQHSHLHNIKKSFNEENEISTIQAAAIIKATKKSFPRIEMWQSVNVNYTQVSIGLTCAEVRTRIYLVRAVKLAI